jgi:hypothetical protein
MLFGLPWVFPDPNCSPRQVERDLHRARAPDPMPICSNTDAHIPIYLPLTLCSLCFCPSSCLSACSVIAETPRHAIRISEEGSAPRLGLSSSTRLFSPVAFVEHSVSLYFLILRFTAMVHLMVAERASRQHGSKCKDGRHFEKFL